ncbi:MAG: hypothetical protein M1817_006180 [Caeruleum heppii]|nr:MAG: hypothetical protein M1817_006180 [Caeruleum heppii]
MTHTYFDPPLPGSFVSDSHLSDRTLPPKLDVNVGPRSHIFQPPRTPSASTSLYQSTASITTQASTASSAISRKRSRRDYAGDDYYNTPGSWRSSWTTTADSFPERSSPVPFVNTKYQLAGGLDTPTGMLQEKYEYRTSHGDSAYRRQWDQVSSRQASLDGPFDTPTALARERNGIGRGTGHGSSASGGGWGRAMVNAVGAVWQFCRGTAFNGFKAGGGTGYEVRRETLGDSSWQEVPETTSLDDVNGHGADHSSSHAHPSPRPAKKIQRSKGEGELQGHYIMVSAKDTPAATSRTSSVSRSSQPRRSTATTAGNVAYSTPTARSAAHRAASRRSGARPSLVSYAGSPSLHSHAKSASFASPRSRSSSPQKPVPSAGRESLNGSPVPIEAQRLMAKRRREERKADESIQRFTTQLRAMIREGKEALGSRVEVEVQEAEEGERDSVALVGDDDEMEGMDVDDGFEDGEETGRLTESGQWSVVLDSRRETA